MPRMPEVCVGFQIIPFALIRRRDRVTDVTAEWLTTWVMRCTFLATIEFGNRRIKSVVEGAKLIRSEVRYAFENFRFVERHGIIVTPHYESCHSDRVAPLAPRPKNLK